MSGRESAKSRRAHQRKQSGCQHPKARRLRHGIRIESRLRNYARARNKITRVVHARSGNRHRIERVRDARARRCVIALRRRIQREAEVRRAARNRRRNQNVVVPFRQLVALPIPAKLSVPGIVISAKLAQFGEGPVTVQPVCVTDPLYVALNVTTTAPLGNRARRPGGRPPRQKAVIDPRLSPYSAPGYRASHCLPAQSPLPSRCRTIPSPSLRRTRCLSRPRSQLTPAHKRPYRRG